MPVESQRLDAEELAASIPEAARQQLAELLDELFATLQHIDAVCPVLFPPCRHQLRFEKLRNLREALVMERKWSSPPGK